MINYIGGKAFLAPWIISNFPPNYELMTYCEPFGGGGWVLFKKPPSNMEIYNDLNVELVNLFRVMRDNFEQFSYKAQWSLHSREMFDEAIKRLEDKNYSDEVEQALLYAIRRIQVFSGGNSKSWAYGIATRKLYSGKWLPFLKKMEAINARLKRVQIECLDFERLIKKYDTRDTLFYCDPPYVEAEHYYTQPGVDFKYEDHRRLNSLLKGIKGKFMVSYYEHPLVRELYGKYRIITKESVKHSAGSTGKNRIGYKKPKVVELLIMNY